VWRLQAEAAKGMTAQARQDFFSVLDPADRIAARGRSRVVRLSKGQAVLSRGVLSSDVFFVQEGTLEVVLQAADGRQVSLRDLRPGALFGELAALDGESRSASIVAQSNARVLAMARADFQGFVEASPKVAIWLNRHLTAQVRALTERVFELSALTVPSRLHCELWRLAKSVGGPQPIIIDPAPTHAALANRIGAQREAVSREISELETLGVLQAGRRRITFLDLPKLEALVRRLAPDSPDGGLTS
jgi:CRP-like cAMP-binding protein